MQYFICCLGFIFSAIFYPLEKQTIIFIIFLIFFLLAFFLVFFFKVNIKYSKKYLLSILISLLFFCYYQVAQQNNKIPNINFNKKDILNLEIVNIKGFGKKYFECKAKVISIEKFNNEEKHEIKTEDNIIRIKKNFFILIKSRWMLTNINIGDIISIKNKKLFWTEDLAPNGYRSYLIQKRIIATLYANPYHLNIKKNSIVFSKDFKKNLWVNLKKLQLQIINKIKNKINFLIDYPASSLTFAMITGDKRDIPNEILEKFRISGTYHLLAVSGLHAGIISLIFFSFFRLFFLRRNTVFVLLLFIFFPLYLFIVDMPISIIRTYFMAVVGFTIKKINKNIDYSKIWAIVFIAVLLISPKEINSISFQLSFSATLGILLFLEIMKNYKIKNSLMQYCIISLAAQIFTAPILIYYFGYLNFFTFFYNISISFIMFLSLLLSVIILLSPIHFINIFLGESITILNHIVFFILEKTTYSLEWFTINKKGNYQFIILTAIIILAISFFIRYLSKKNHHKNITI